MIMFRRKQALEKLSLEEAYSALAAAMGEEGEYGEEEVKE